MTALTTPPPLSDQLCFAIYSANIAINRTYLPVLGQLGLTYPQYLVLCVLAERDQQTIGGIADRLALEASTVTPLVKRLEAAGHLSRARNPADERQVVVKLSPTGRDLYVRAAVLTETLMMRLGTVDCGANAIIRNARELVHRLAPTKSPIEEQDDV